MFVCSMCSAEGRVGMFVVDAKPTLSGFMGTNQHSRFSELLLFGSYEGATTWITKSMAFDTRHRNV